MTDYEIIMARMNSLGGDNQGPWDNGADEQPIYLWRFVDAFTHWYQPATEAQAKQILQKTGVGSMEQVRE